MNAENIGGALKRALPSILTVLGSVGVVGTAILTAKTMHDIDESGEDPKKSWKKFWKAGLVGAATIGCITGSNFLNKKQQVSIASGAVMFTETLRRYQQKIKEEFPEVHEKVMDEIKMEHTKDVYVHTRGIMGGNSIIFEGVSEPTQQCHDCFSDEYFECRPSQVYQAFYHANRNFSLGNFEMYNRYREFCGLEPKDDQDDFMWMLNDDMLWIDFNVERRTDKDGNDILVNGRPVFDISMEWNPMTQEEWEDELPRASYYPDYE